MEQSNQEKSTAIRGPRSDGTHCRMWMVVKGKLTENSPCYTKLQFGAQILKFFRIRGEMLVTPNCDLMIVGIEYYSLSVTH